MNKNNTLLDIIKNSKSAVIISHVGPDGDALGSMLGMKFILKQFENIKTIDCIILGKYPEIYKFLPGSNSVKTPYDDTLLDKYDVAIAVDCAALDRLTDAVEIFKRAKNTVNIDHHITGDKFAQLNIINGEASSAGEMIVDIAQKLGVQITSEIAINLYVSILTDTGGFKFENTKAQTFLACAKLLEIGISPDEIFKKCYEQKPLDMIRLQAKAINNAKFEENDKIAYAIISRKLLDEFGSQDSYTDGVSEKLRQAKTTQIAMTLKETQSGDTKISLRSKAIDVSKMAKFFGGGGHKLAAGCTIEKPPQEALEEILPIARKQIKLYEENFKKDIQKN